MTEEGRGAVPWILGPMRNEVEGVVTEPLATGYRTMADVAYTALRRRILSGDLPAGQRIDQDAEARRLEASRMPIREALRRLEAEGLVEVTRHRGARVRPLSVDDLEDLYVLRIAVETVAGRLGAERISAGALEQMRNLMPEMESIVLRVDPVAWLEVDWTFHSTLYASARHPRLLHTIQGLWEEVGRYRKLGLARREELETSLGEHRAIIAACEQHDGLEAERVIRRALERSQGTLPHLLRQTGFGEDAVVDSASNSEP